MITLKEHVFRRDVDDYFKLSGILTTPVLDHTPFIVFNGDTVELCRSVAQLKMMYVPDTWVIGQWRGVKKSDYFKFQVRDLQKYIASHQI